MARTVDIIVGSQGLMVGDGQIFPGQKIATVTLHDVEITTPKKDGPAEKGTYEPNFRYVADGFVGGRFKEQLGEGSAVDSAVAVPLTNVHAQNKAPTAAEKLQRQAEALGLGVVSSDSKDPADSNDPSDAKDE